MKGWEEWWPKKCKRKCLLVTASLKCVKVIVVIDGEREGDVREIYTLPVSNVQMMGLRYVY